MNDRQIGLIQRAAERLRQQQPEIGAPPPPQPAPAAAPAPAHEGDGPRLSREIRIDRQRLAKAGIIFTNTERSRVAEEFRIIIRQILAKAQQAASEHSENSRLIMITSARPREGKTFTSINIALAIASQLDFRVLAMDCDVERQSMSSVLGIEPDKGLVDLIADDTLDMRDILLRTDVANLTVLPAGRKRPGVPELLSSRRMRDILAEIEHRYSDRYIVIDAPPCLATSDPSILAPMVGQIVFVVEANRTQEAEIEESLRLVSACPNISLVLNKMEGTTSEHFGSYGYY
ncbi:MAG TPA: XrtA-associated tyrosine autokinase [Solirubrobacteraceae bacterium]|nr:XrtA-associated tyrosine autokinase [Solirubrobacteraceae bacterium]